MDELRVYSKLNKHIRDIIDAYASYVVKIEYYEWPDLINRTVSERVVSECVLHPLNEATLYTINNVKNIVYLDIGMRYSKSISCYQGLSIGNQMNIINEKNLIIVAIEYKEDIKAVRLLIHRIVL